MFFEFVPVLRQIELFVPDIQSTRLAVSQFYVGLSRVLLAILVFASPVALAVDFRGFVDLRFVSSQSELSWLHDGFGKTRFDRSSGVAKLGQAFLRADSDLFDSVTASVVASANDDRRGLLDVNEAWLSWNPVPTSPWKTRLKAGSFFPATNLEIDYESIGWTPSHTISSSAINSWVGEELRTTGVELTMIRKGISEGSLHDFGFTAALFGGNDPAGTLLAWRGWSISDRITGLTESLRLTDLPVIRTNGALPDQDRSVHPFRELDNRLGYHVGTQYGYAGWLKFDAMRYDNGGNALLLKNGQYSWRTRFTHLGLRMAPYGNLELVAQVMRGNTLMGPNAVRLGFDAWFLLARHPIGSGTVAVRFDRFATREHFADVLPSDPNGEQGRSWAIAYTVPLSKSTALVTEALSVSSRRDARRSLGINPDQSEHSVSTAIRWHF